MQQHCGGVSDGGSGGGTQARGNTSDSTAHGGREREHRHGNDTGNPAGHSGKQEGGRGGGMTVAGDREEGQ